MALEMLIIKLNNETLQRYSGSDVTINAAVARTASSSTSKGLASI